MNADGYQSYIVRIRRRETAQEPGGVRADIEDLLGGGRVSLRGELARSLARDIESLLQRSTGDAESDARRRETA